MAVPQSKEFSLAHEVNTLRKMLMLPVTHVVFDNRYQYGKMYMDESMNFIVFYATLYVNDEVIGNIPYMSAGFEPMYITDKQTDLAWDKIYRQYHTDIMGKIIQQEPLAAIGEIWRYKFLFIKDENGTVIRTAFCNYVNDEWEVVLDGPNPVDVVRTATVILASPPMNRTSMPYYYQWRLP